MFGLKEWGQQFLITDDGIHMTGNKETKIRFQLVENNNKQQQQGGSGKSAGTHAAGGNGSSGAQSGGQQQNKPTGQKSLHKQEAKTFHEISEEAQHLARGDGHHKISDKKIINYYKDETNSNQVTIASHIRYGDNRIFSDVGLLVDCGHRDQARSDQSAATLAAWEERRAASAPTRTQKLTRRLASATPGRNRCWLLATSTTWRRPAPCSARS
jgi:hypothetical protein